MNPTVACIDLGNSRTHIGLVVDRTVSQDLHLPTRSYAESLERWLATKRIDGIGWCSVVPACNPTLQTLARKYSRNVFNLNHEDAPGLPISYPKPAEIGQDRLANAIAAQVVAATPAIVLDAGTAVTCDVVLPEYGYVGGLIAPGLAIMTDYLHEKTAQLPRVPLEKLSTSAPFGQSTADSMALACAVSFGGMVTALARRAEQEAEKRGFASPAFLATGGSAQHLLDDSRPWRWVEGLTLIGLAEAWCRKQGSG